jgi:hypothetical protein
VSDLLDLLPADHVWRPELRSARRTRAGHGS